MSDISTRIRNSTFVSRIPTPGALFGLNGSAAVLEHFNNNRGASFFGTAQDRYAQVFHEFTEHIWKPLDAGIKMVASTVNAIINPDVFRPLWNVEELKSTPFCMQLPILYFEPVRELLESGRVHGYGYSPTDIVGEDKWGRLIANGTIDHTTKRDENGNHIITEIYMSGDPVLSSDELDAIDDTRRFIADLIRTTDIDPTNVEFVRG